MRLVLIASLLVGLLAGRAEAWSEAGHRIIASIAFRQLTAPQQSRLVRLLEQHPRFQEDFQKHIPADLSPEDRPEWIFQQAALWPDLARGIPEEVRSAFHHPTWHYINRPFYLTARDQEQLQSLLTVNLDLDPPASGDIEALNVIQAIRYARQQQSRPNHPASERALLLSWLFHNVGDVHQPLHSSAMFAEGLFPEGDRGGNLIRTGQRSNLHSVWDGLPGGRMPLREARNRALKLMSHSELRNLGTAAGRQLHEDVWLEESHSACRDAVYTPEVMAHLRSLPRREMPQLPPLSLTEDYLKTAGAVAERRVVQAGYRLGAILQEVAGPDAGSGRQ